MDQNKIPLEVAAAVFQHGRDKEGGVRAAAGIMGLSQSDARRSIQTAALSAEANSAERDLGSDEHGTALRNEASCETAEEQMTALFDIAAQQMQACLAKQGHGFAPTSVDDPRSDEARLDSFSVDENNEADDNEANEASQERSQITPPASPSSGPPHYHQDDLDMARSKLARWFSGMTPAQHHEFCDIMHFRFGKDILFAELAGDLEDLGVVYSIEEFIADNA